jgi:hypothetical protein
LETRLLLTYAYLLDHRLPAPVRDQTIKHLNLNKKMRARQRHINPKNVAGNTLGAGARLLGVEISYTAS